VGKLLLPALQVLVAHRAAYAGGIDVQQHEIPPAAKALIGDPSDLLRVGAVDESFCRERVRCVRTCRPSLGPRLLRRDVEDLIQGSRPFISSARQRAALANTVSTVSPFASPARMCCSRAMSRSSATPMSAAFVAHT
jgi:hypothetical protein